VRLWASFHMRKGLNLQITPKALECHEGCLFIALSWNTI
jgi:hypothetical protein